MAQQRNTIVFSSVPIGIGTHSSIVSRTMNMCIYVLSPNLILFADARHYYPLIINASQAIRVQTSLNSENAIYETVQNPYHAPP